MGLIGKKCDYCKTSIPKEATFCPNCGKEQKKIFGRVKAVKEDEGYKCPHCGGDFKVFSCLCPHCGKEQIGQIRSKSILQFTQELQRLDEKKSKSGVIAVLNSKKIKNLEEQKLNYIQTFVVPNAKEDVLEFMVLASTNFNPYIMSAQSGEEVNLKAKEFQKQKMLSQAWHTKMEQVYKKAYAAFGADEDFVVIKNIFDEKEQILNQITTDKIREKKKKQMILGAMIAGWFVIALVASALGGGDEKSNNDEKAAIVETEYKDNNDEVSERTVLGLDDHEVLGLDNSSDDYDADVIEPREIPSIPEYKSVDINEIMYVKSLVSVKGSPDKNGEFLGTLVANDEVNVTGIVNYGWYRIDYNNNEAYVSADSLITQEEIKKAEEKRIAEEQAKVAEEKRIAEEQAKVAEEKRIAEEQAKAAEEKRIAEEQTKAAEEKRIAEEQAKAAEEKRLAEEAAKAEEERRKAEATAAAPVVTGGGRTVFIAPDSGQKYHYKSNCRGLKKANSIIEVTIDEAIAQGKTLCGYED